MTTAEAIALANTNWWINQPVDVVARFQLAQSLLCMDFCAFHQAVERALRRSVWTHEFGNAKALLDELNGDKAAPTLQQVIDMIPEAKTVLVEI